MSNSSTTSIQSIVDEINTLGELMPVLPSGGYSAVSAVATANRIRKILLGQRFTWKFNRMVCPAFYTNSYQQDYAQIGLTALAWLENANWVDINSTSQPKPQYPIEAVRDLPLTSWTGNPPGKMCWYPNSQLSQGQWPGANQTYTTPIGANQTPSNPPTNILDANGNILVLTTYGVTGETAPVLPANSSDGTTVADGSCVWTVAGPNSIGFRLVPMPPQQGVVYQINSYGQMKPPANFTKLGDFINPFPDEYSHHFTDGFIAFAYQLSPNPKMQELFERKQQSWLASIAASFTQGDREIDNAGFIPDRSAMAPGGGTDIGPAMPYLYNVWPGR